MSTELTKVSQPMKKKNLVFQEEIQDSTHYMRAIQSSWESLHLQRQPKICRSWDQRGVGPMPTGLDSRIVATDRRYRAFVIIGREIRDEPKGIYNDF